MSAALLAFLFAFAGCGMVTENIAPSELVKTSPNDAIILVGVKQSYVVGIHKGIYEGEAWRKDFFAAYSSKTTPQNGYITVRLPARTGDSSYGISAVMDGSFFFEPCTGTNTLTFEAPSGKIVYVGDIDFERSGRQLSFRVFSNAERARLYVREKFPSLVDDLVVLSPTLSKTVGIDCAPTTIPIYMR